MCFSTICLRFHLSAGHGLAVSLFVPCSAIIMGERMVHMSGKIRIFYGIVFCKVGFFR
jgi:hypothetical protein